MKNVSMDELNVVLRDFYNLTQFMIVVYDSDRRVLTSYPGKMSQFCCAVRRSPLLAEKCIECDNHGFDICDKTRKPYIYKCHMGITEAVVPIYANDVNIGYLMFGQILSDDRESLRKCAQRAEIQYDIRIGDRAVDSIVTADQAFIASAANMMAMCASYLYTSEIIRKNPNILEYQLKEYISENLAQDLSTQHLCQHFYISRTKLYSISRDCFGMGISDYIRTERIKRAKRLLANSTETVACIATAVGIADTNYFIRTFKALVGVTPLQYRKRKQIDGSPNFSTP